MRAVLEVAEDLGLIEAARAEQLEQLGAGRMLHHLDAAGVNRAIAGDEGLAMNENSPCRQILDVRQVVREPVRGRQRTPHAQPAAAQCEQLSDIEYLAARRI